MTDVRPKPHVDRPDAGLARSSVPQVRPAETPAGPPMHTGNAQVADVGIACSFATVLERLTALRTNATDGDQLLVFSKRAPILVFFSVSQEIRADEVQAVLDAGKTVTARRAHMNHAQLRQVGGTSDFLWPSEVRGSVRELNSVADFQAFVRANNNGVLPRRTPTDDVPRVAAPATNAPRVVSDAPVTELSAASRMSLQRLDNRIRYGSEGDKVLVFSERKNAWLGGLLQRWTTCEAGAVAGRLEAGAVIQVSNAVMRDGWSLSEWKPVCVPHTTRGDRTFTSIAELETWLRDGAHVGRA